MDRWDDIHTFHYTGKSFDPTFGVASFYYLARGATSEYPLTELVTFPLPERQPDARTLAVLERVLELLYVAVGTIYYKSMAPESVMLDTVRLAPAAQRWALRLSRSGLAEFAYRWQLPHVLDLNLAGQSGDTAAIGYDAATGERPPLVTLGGGEGLDRVVGGAEGCGPPSGGVHGGAAADTIAQRDDDTDRRSPG